MKIGNLPRERDGTAETPSAPVENTPTAFKLFLVLSAINSVTLGGGYVIVPAIGTAFEKRGWITEERYYDIFARAQAYPGPLALSTSMLVSLELCGLKGAVAAFFGVITPPFLAIILVGAALARYGDLPAVRRFLEGAGAIVPGIVAAMIWKTAKRQKWTARLAAQLAILTALLILFPSASLPILLGGLAFFYLLEGLWKR